MGCRTRFGSGFCALLFIFTAIPVMAAEDVNLQPQGLDSAGIYGLRRKDASLTGADTTIALICRSITYSEGKPQNDYRPDTNHPCFEKSNFQFLDDACQPAGVSEHSTAICSILFGQDPNAFTSSLGKFRYEGIAYDANAQVFEFWHFLKNNVFNNNPPQADIVSASIGTVFEDWWTRGIEAAAEQHGMLVIAGIGNGADAHDPPLYPAAGANVIGVGVAKTMSSANPESLSSNSAQVRPTNSSCGPTDDGRCKPDLVAGGDFLVAAACEPNSYQYCGNYSSFATPAVAGTAALLLQKAKADQNLTAAFEGKGRNCLVKAILMNSARKLPYWHKGKIQKQDDHYVPLDRVQGAGMLDALAAYNTLITGRYNPTQPALNGWDLGHLTTNKKTKNIYQLAISEPNEKMITATVCWNRRYEKSYPFEAIVEKDTDIRMELWAFDSTSQKPDKLLDYSDSKLDNTEHIYCPADVNYTEYKIVILLADTDPTGQKILQGYALAWSAGEKRQTELSQWYDLNCDGKVNEQDFGILINNVFQFTKNTDEYLVGDINEDGRLDMNDIDIFLDYITPDPQR